MRPCLNKRKTEVIVMLKKLVMPSYQVNVSNISSGRLKKFTYLGTYMTVQTNDGNCRDSQNNLRKKAKKLIQFITNEKNTPKQSSWFGDIVTKNKKKATICCVNWKQNCGKRGGGRQRKKILDRLMQ